MAAAGFDITDWTARVPGVMPFRSAIIFGLAALVFSGTSTLSAATKKTIQQLTSIFENSTTDLQYTFVANIGDLRGYTFGFAGFTSGTYSGSFFLKEYERLRPDNPLVRFIPAFDRIDAGPHDAAGRNPDTAGLEDFPDVFRSCGDDPAFRRAQHLLVDRLSWRPSARVARRVGARFALTRGQLYDAYVNHGESGVVRLLRSTNRRAGGTPRDGVGERKWLKAFLAVRLRTLRADPVWALAVDRIAVYERLLAEGNLRLRRPMEIHCYGNHFSLR